MAFYLWMIKGQSPSEHQNGLICSLAFFFSISWRFFSNPFITFESILFKVRRTNPGCQITSSPDGGNKIMHPVCSYYRSNRCFPHGNCLFVTFKCCFYKNNPMAMHQHTANSFKPRDGLSLFPPVRLALCLPAAQNNETWFLFVVFSFPISFFPPLLPHASVLSVFPSLQATRALFLWEP